MSKSLPIFFDSPACQNRLACSRCRDQGPVGNGFRATLTKAFARIPQRDFPCPVGVPWSTTTFSPTVVAVAGLPPPPSLLAEAEETKKVCEECPHYLGMKTRLTVLCDLVGKACRCMALTSGNKCPDGRWDRSVRNAA